MRKLLVALQVWAALVLGSAEVEAQVLKCKDNSGNVTYTQAQCPPGTTPADLPETLERDLVSVPSGGADGPGHAACTPNLILEGSNESVRACSRSQGLPSTTRWAQIKEHVNDSGSSHIKWTGEYLCLRFIETPDAQGGSLRLRPLLTIEKLPTPPGSTESYVLRNGRGTMTFPTKVAAVEYGCEHFREL